ncbi:MAG: imidazolonepropionase [Myxococcota bacterium]
MTHHCYHGISQLLTMGGAANAQSAEEALGVIEDAALVVDATGHVTWVGPGAEKPTTETDTDLGGALVMPGFVDAHTHVVFAGDRTGDFTARCAGETYQEIAARGGGIRLTVNATRSASLEELVTLALPRLQELLEHGVTTVEVKSGYGLSVADELRMLEAIAQLDTMGPWRLIPTLLAAHIIPDEFKGDREGYVALVNDELLPEVARRGLARHVDVFCDTGAFTLTETLSILERGRALGLGLKVHAEQLTHTGASGAAAALGAVSADHLEHIAPQDISAMAKSGTAAVLMPAVALFLGEEHRAPARALLEAGVPVALATDCNPGSCPTRHLPLVASLGCTWLGMAPHEALHGITRAAAHAVGLDDGTGTLTPGAPADFITSMLPSWQHLPYRFGHNPIQDVFIAGRRVLSRLQPGYGEELDVLHHCQEDPQGESPC